MAWFREILRLIVLVISLSLPNILLAGERVQVVEEQQPYLYGWSWEMRPDSMVRIPRQPASLKDGADDHPLRVQRELPRYRHFRSAAQIHWDLARER